MNFPKVIAVQALDEKTLLVEFNNNEIKEYDVSPLLSNSMFAPLRNPFFFKSVHVEPGGYAVAWNDEVDISEYELWKHGRPASLLLQSRKKR